MHNFPSTIPTADVIEFYCYQFDIKPVKLATTL